MKNRKISSSEIVYKAISEKLMTRQWLPGMKIASENQLAQELGVSRMSVREALEKLVALNVITKKQGEGTFVNELSPSAYLDNLIPMILLKEDSLSDILEFRRMIETENARLCAQRCDDATIEALEKDCEEMSRHKERASQEFADADYDFHLQIAKGTGNSLIVKVYSLLNDLFRVHSEMLNKKLGPDKGPHGHHERILEAIKEREPELAAIYMKRHIESVSERLEAYKEGEKKHRKD